MRRSPFGLVLSSAALLMFPACATVGPPLPPSLDLPKPPSDLKAVRKGETVTLTWTIPTITTDRQRTKSFGPTRICRGMQKELTDCETAVGENTVTPLPNTRSSDKKPTASYTDKLPSQLEADDPSAFAIYAVQVQNADGRSAGLSNQVSVPLVRTLPPPHTFQAHMSKEGVVLSWTNSIMPSEQPAEIHHVYRIYRRAEGETKSILAATVPVSTEREMTTTDSNFDWEKTYLYRIETVTVIKTTTEEQVDGDDSPEIKIFAHDTFPPAVPSGLQAVFSGPGQKPFIDLIWAPVPDIDLDGYNVYRHEEGTPPVKINPTLVKTPAYRDANVISGKHYIYSVSAVDVRGNESARSEEATENVP